MSALVDFLQTFGPVASSDSLCDENLGLSQAQFNVTPLDTPPDRLEDICNALLCEAPRSIVLTGTAGDGKTYHIRQFFKQQFPARMDEWPGDDDVVEAVLPSGHQLRIIRDLSEVGDETKVSELRQLVEVLTGSDRSTVYLMAANDGHLLKYFREASKGGSEVARQAETVHATLSQLLRSDLEEDPSLALQLINLSRAWSDRTVERIFDAVLEHEAWDDGCQNCPALTSDNPCPIRLNRSLLRPSEGKPSPFRQRLHEALRLAAANDQHVPIRQLLTLVVNIILGDERNPDAPLLDCETARKRASERDYLWTNPYNNAVGLNLRPERRQANRVFRIFEVFALGFETNNLVDSSLVNGKPEPLRDRIFAGERTYGADLFRAAHDQYFMTGSATAVREFRRALEAQRRRAFFRLTDTPDQGMDSPWRLTIFHHGGDYLRLLDMLSGEPTREKTDQYTRKLIQGLNRAFTGLMATDEDQLWLAGSIGRTDDLSGRVTTIDALERSRQNSFLVRLVLDERTARPSLAVVPPRHFRLDEGVTLPRLDLRPLLFEYLMRVASGSLPSSFSRQCHQEIRHFALMTRGVLERLQPLAEDEPQTVRVISLGGRGEIRAEAIEI